jgi:hypothetical protein
MPFNERLRAIQRLIQDLKSIFFGGMIYFVNLPLDEQEYDNDYGGEGEDGFF